MKLVTDNINKNIKEDIVYIDIKNPDGLPSKFLSYPSGATIKYRPYTYGELLRLSQHKLEEIPEIEFILEGIETSFDKLDLLYMDYLYLAMLRKISSSESISFTAIILCEKCGEQNKLSRDLTDISFEELKVSKLPIIFEENGREAYFIPMTLKSYIDIHKENKTEDYTYAMAAQIINMNRKDAYDFVYKSKEGDVLKYIDGQLYFDVADDKFVCSKCKAENVFKLTDRGLLLRTSSRSEDIIRDKIRFGL